MPDLSAPRDDLWATIDDPSMRELISTALLPSASDRPTAEKLLQTISRLAPSQVFAGQFKKQVFASMRFNEAGPMAEAKYLRGKLAAHGVHLHIITPLPGESIDEAVFCTMAKCDAFLAMGTHDVSVE